MHRDWTSGVFSTVETFTRIPKPLAGPKSLFVEHEDDEDDDEGDEAAEPFTDGVEVIESSQVAQDVAITSPTALDDDREASLRTAEAFTSPLKFETPALAGRKRDSSAQMRSSNTNIETTPDTAASASAFGGAFGVSGIGQPLSLTQAFDLTQARTSPVMAGTEDPIFQRPSPNFQYFRHSSPVPAQSSPIRVMRNGRSDPVIRSSSEPRSEYVTMKESQERRKQAQGAHPPPLVQEDSWEELSVAQKRLQRKRQRQQAYHAASLSLSSVSAPVHVTRKHSGHAQHSPEEGSHARHAWHDGVQEDEDVAMDDPSQHLAPEADEADHTSGSSSQDDAAAAQAPMRYSGLGDGVQVPKTSSHPQRTQTDQTNGDVVQLATPSSQMQRESQVPASASQSILRTAPHSSRGSVAVMDSQPDMNTNYESWPPRPDLRFPSSPSINQYSINQTTVASRTGYTSQMVSSSMVPMPPRLSPGVEEDDAPEEEERVPSSPPMLTDDLTNDLIYDEHGYDEHSEVDADQEIDEMVHAEGDVRVEEEDDLPVASPSVDAEENDVTAGLEQDADDESEVTQPQKVDNDTDDEVPETLEEDQRQCSIQAEAAEPPIKLKAESSGLAASTLQRQNTVPETDALDETQRSHFAEPATAAEGNATLSHTDQGDAEVNEDTNGNESFQTGPVDDTESQPHMPAPNSSRDDGSDPIHDVNRIRSLIDIANLPNTQRSAGEDDIEMPTFSGFEDADGDAHMDDFVFATPAAKRRKIAPANADDEEGTSHGPVENVAVEGQEQATAPSPLKPLQQQRDETSPPASAKEREDKGAFAEQAREEVVAAYGRPATLKSKASSRPARPLNNKKGSLKSARAVIATMSSPAKSPSKPKASATVQKPAPTTPSRKLTKPVDTAVDVEMRDAGDSTDELASSPPPPPSATPLPVRLTPQKLGINTSEVVVPKRVFASWPGSHYYPATCIGRSDSKHLQIRFDDGNTTSLEAFLVRSLELLPGDQVKVDEAGMKKNTYVVVGVTDKCADLHNYEFPLTDRFGNVSVILEEKQRESLPAGREAPKPKQVTVYIANVYLTSQLWGRLRNRAFELSPPPSPEKTVSHLGTPVTADTSATPSFTRRGLAAPSFLKDVTNRAGSVASSIQAGSGTFSNMAFVLTSTGDAMDKDAIARAIKTNGGRVLEHGFHELFDTASIEASSSQSRHNSASDADTTNTLTLKEDLKKLGFVALITDSHSRSTKFLQALALNVPCLHLRWIHDSLSASRALGFARYLLPAGLSKYLDPAGTVRSRAMRIYNPAAEAVSFEQTFLARELMLRDQNVLLVTGKSKKEIERRQPFVFLTNALGAKSVGQVPDLEAAMKILAQGGGGGGGDWVFVEGEHNNVTDAAGVLFGKGEKAVQGKKGGVAGKKGRKRKRDRDEGEGEVLCQKGVVGGKAGGREVQVACAEFVIQSLILGGLVDG